jgi:hypothetical protein
MGLAETIARAMRPLGGVREDGLDELVRAAESVDCLAGDHILQTNSPDQHVYIVHSGLIALLVPAPDDSPAVCGVAGPGRIIGLIRPFVERQLDARAIMASTLVRLPRTRVLRAMGLNLTPLGLRGQPQAGYEREISAVGGLVAGGRDIVVTGTESCPALFDRELQLWATSKGGRVWGLCADCPRPEARGCPLAGLSPGAVHMLWPPSRVSR